MARGPWPSADSGCKTRCVVISEGRVADGPYGIDEFARLGYGLADVGAARGRVHRKLRDVVEHRSGVRVDKAVRSLPLTRHAGLTLAIFEPYAVAPAWLKRHRAPGYVGHPLVMIACWLADELRRCGSRSERLVMARRFRGVDLTLVFSGNQLDVLTESGFAREALAVVPFGFAPGLFPVADFAERNDRLVAVGFDRGRDYATLIEAARGTPVVVDLYCTASNISGIDLPENVRFHGTVPFAEYRQIVARAGAVVVPTHDMAYPSGQTVALESAATGACVLVSDTAALREYFTPDTARLVPVDDVPAWRAELLRIVQSPELRRQTGDAAARRVRERFTYAHLWAAVDRVLRERGLV